MNLRHLADSVSAGILIAVGGTVYLSCENKVIGAIFFAVALLCICTKKYYLYTGKCASLADDISKENTKLLLTGLAVNLATAYIMGLVISFAVPAIKETATTACLQKLSQGWLQAFIRATMCGVLMYQAVSSFNGSPLSLLYGIPVFILCGFEHSIADTFYFGAAGMFNGKADWFIFVAVLGNTFGAVLLPLMRRLTNGRE